MYRVSVAIGVISCQFSYWHLCLYLDREGPVAIGICPLSL